MSQDLEVIEEVQQPKIKEPSMFKVLLLNDDYTPMDFVVGLLKKFFTMSEEQATQVMMQVHTEGCGVCGTYTKEIAETRKKQIIEYARNHQHILKSDIEEVD